MAAAAWVWDAPPDAQEDTPEDVGDTEAEIRERLIALGIGAEVARDVAAAAQAGPRIPGLEDGTDAEDRALLGAAVAAARDARTLADVLPPLLAALRPRAPRLAPAARGVLAHLEGLAAWRVEGDVVGASAALGRALEHLGEGSENAPIYAARVEDTLGQLLHHQGQLEDARVAFERALSAKEADGDGEGAALTRGNLGRLCMDLGDFEAAVRHLEADLAHVTAAHPEWTRLCSQLSTEIGACHTERGDYASARTSLDAARHLAEQARDAVGVAFAEVYRARLALREGDARAARAHVDSLRDRLASLPVEIGGAIEGLLLQADAELHAAGGDLDGARRRFEAAEACFGRLKRVSPIEHAELLEAHAAAAERLGRREEAARLLRRALRLLDGTTAETRRAELEAKLHRIDEASWLLHATGRFVGHGQIEFLLREASQDGFRGHEAEVVVLFSDLRGFTTLAEALDPESLVSLLNRYLGHMTRCIEHHGGLVDKFIGDAVMAVFSLPRPAVDDADRALAAASFMQAELARMNRSLPTGVPPLSAGIGLHTGRVVAGLIGSPQKRSYTVIGDVVNTASRLEGMTKILGTSLLLTAEVRARLQRDTTVALEPLGSWRPKGRRGAVEVFHVLGDATDEAALATIAQTTAALHLLRGRDFDGAARELRTLALARGGGAGRQALDRLAEAAQAFQLSPPPFDWDGSIELREK